MRHTAIVLLILACAGAAPWAAGREATDRPNVLLILVDDLGYADVGFHGNKDFPTPHLDALARSGIVCANGYASHSFCAPTRAGLMTGRHQSRFGFEGNPKWTADEGLPLDQITLPQILNPVGYTSALVGKWHLGLPDKYHPLQRGFDWFYGFRGGGHDYFKAQVEGKPRREYEMALEHNGRKIGINGYITDDFTDAAIDFIDQHHDGPFFLFLSYNAPHGPLQAPRRYLDRVSSIKDKRRQTYAAMVTAVDDGVGRVIETLERHELIDNTVVFFFSDNGGPPWANASSNKPLRGTKGLVYEGGIHVPFVVSWPGQLPSGATYTHPVISFDVFATAAELAGAKLPDDRVIDSVNLIPYLNGSRITPPHEALYWRQGEGYQLAIRMGPHKLLRVAGRAPEVYDLVRDLRESSDLAGSRPDLTERLDRAVESWHERMPSTDFTSTGLSKPDQYRALGLTPD
ncbi:MAG: sulfatase-like hydrolase/transferase [Planctomycetota bacterium]|jgi:arylsulfatase A-like enzyme